MPRQVDLENWLAQRQNPNAAPSNPAAARAVGRTAAKRVMGSSVDALLAPQRPSIPPRAPPIDMTAVLNAAVSKGVVGALARRNAMRQQKALANAQPQLQQPQLGVNIGMPQIQPPPNVTIGQPQIIPQQPPQMLTLPPQGPFPAGPGPVPRQMTLPPMQIPIGQ